MSLSPQKFREMVFQLLYSHDIGHPNEDLMIELMMAELVVSKKNVRLALDKVYRILDKLPDIDSRITAVSTSYAFDRIQSVTKNILRVAVFELFFDEEIPPKVAIAEAMRLSRKFGTPESANFVNALLDHLYKAILGNQSSLEELEHKAQDLLQSEEQARQAVLDLQKEELPKEDETLE